MCSSSFTCGRLEALQSCISCQTVTSGLLPAGPTSKDIFAKDPDRLLTEIVVKDEATMTSYHYRVQDTPGLLLHCRCRWCSCGALMGGSRQMSHACIVAAITPGYWGAKKLSCCRL